MGPKNGTRNVDGTKFAAHQSVLLGCLSIPESFVQIGHSRKKFYFIRKGSKKAGAPIFNGQKNGTRNVDGTKFAAHQSVLLGSLSIPESFVKIEQSRKKFYFIRGARKKKQKNHHPDALKGLGPGAGSS